METYTERTHVDPSKYVTVITDKLTCDIQRILGEICSHKVPSHVYIHPQTHTRVNLAQSHT